MRILILEDEPLIALDIELIVEDACQAECLLSRTVESAMRHVDAGVDFAMLDVDLGSHGEDSLPVALQLLARRIPFCFVSATLGRLPATFKGVPRVGKPFRQQDIIGVLPKAA